MSPFFRKHDGVDTSPSRGPGIGHSPWRLPQEAQLLSLNCYLHIESPGGGSCLCPGLSVSRLAPLNANAVLLLSARTGLARQGLSADMFPGSGDPGSLLPHQVWEQVEPQPYSN